jgi:oligopeptide/dipeptide ABC transporter ATP-binding protein
VVAENADVVNVMYASRIVESATVEDLFDHPQHPYTEGLFRSVPRLGGHKERLDTIPGTVPNPARFPSGCKFHPRCPRTRALAAAQVAGGQAAGQVQLTYKGGGGPAVPDVVEIQTQDDRANVMGVCVRDEPALREVRPAHWGACHFIENFAQSPVTPPRSAHRREVVPEVIDGGAQKPLPDASNLAEVLRGTEVTR